MSSGGKAAISPGAGSGSPASKPVSTPAPAPSSTVSASPAPTAGVRRSSRPLSGSSARKASLERRRAMSTRGKQAVSSRDRTRSANERAKPVPSQASQRPADKPADCGCGCGGGGATRERTSGSKATAPARTRSRRPQRPAIAQNPSKAAALARRRAQSERGKAGLSNGGMSEAQTARATNPQLSGRDLARALREQRSRRGAMGQKKSAPSGRRRKASERSTGAASDQPWKVGAGETSQGQTVTGTMVGRDKSVTGDEASTCRDITGTEYLGADIFREFCQAEPTRKPQRGGKSSTSRGNSVTGNEVGRSNKVTGDEPGTCKRVTGSEYVSAEQASAFCGSDLQPAPSRVTGSETSKGKSVTGNNVGRTSKVTGNESGASRELTGTQYTNTAEQAEGKVPAKVGTSKTLRGGSVSGSMVGRREKMTGDEAGSCRNITGDDYIGQEQYTGFCNSKPEPKDRKVGRSATSGGESVTGSMTGRSMKVTGNEPGTCKAVTGTPYAGVEQYVTHCETEQTFAARRRMDPAKRSFGMPMTGQQPAVAGKMTGDRKGACEPVSGTPYVGADQVAEACPAIAAEPGSPDFPQPLDSAPGTEFTVDSPSHAAQQPARRGLVTGASYEQGGHITGPFGMAGGKVTGTEEARFGQREEAPQLQVETAPAIDGRVKSRITGEGQSAGSKITGDDWDRGDRVTGTEGASATRRNQTLRGAPKGAMGARAVERAEAPEPVSKVTGASGNTDRGSLITYSGGARG